MLAKEKRTWCPGCGNFPILMAVDALMNREKFLDIRNIVVVSGIGQAAKFPHHLSPCNGFAGLHGRSIPNATGIKIANHKLEVILFSGDGDLLAEGGNHMIHSLRRNVNLKIILFNNEIYGLTKGQYSPTTPQGQKTKTTPFGSVDAPFNPLQLALGAGATFVARWTTQKPKRAIKSIKKALLHEGFSFVEIVCQCPTNFGRRALSTDDAVECLEWIKENSFTIRQAAEMSPETLEYKFVLGEFVDVNRPVFAGSSVLYK